MSNFSSETIFSTQEDLPFSKLMYTRKVLPNEKFKIFQTIYTGYMSKNEHGQVNFMQTTLASILNACATQKITEFLLSERILRDLIENDLNSKRKTLSGNDYKLFLKVAIMDKKWLEVVKKPSKPGAKVNRAGTYRIDCTELNDYLNTSQATSLISSRDTSHVYVYVPVYGNGDGDVAPDADATLQQQHHNTDVLGNGNGNPKPPIEPASVIEFRDVFPWVLEFRQSLRVALCTRKQLIQEVELLASRTFDAVKSSHYVDMEVLFACIEPMFRERFKTDDQNLDWKYDGKYHLMVVAAIKRLYQPWATALIQERINDDRLAEMQARKPPSVVL